MWELSTFSWWWWCLYSVDLIFFLKHQEEEEERDDDVQFFTSVVRMGEENLRRFLDEARNNPDTLREFMMRFI